MKSFKEFLLEISKLPQKSLISLLHHPMHGDHHAVGTPGHASIRRKLRIGKKVDGSEGDEFEHTGFANYIKDKKTIKIVHYKKPKPEHKDGFEKKIRKQYKVPKDHTFLHTDVLGDET